jgi:hypothetical protein
VNNRFLIAILLSALLFNCKAQTSFESSELSNLYSRLPESIKREILQTVNKKADSSLDSQFVWNDKTLAVIIENSKLTHIGIQLNGINGLNEYDLLVKRFIERALLRLSLDKSISEMVNTAETMQLKILLQDQDIRFASMNDFNELISFINSSTHFTLAKNNYLFAARWKNNGQVLSIQFLNSYQLITGKNKKELDDELCLNLGRMVLSDSGAAKTATMVNSIDSLKVTEIRESKFMDLLSSQLFYKMTNNDSILVFESDLISESVQNLFLDKRISGERKLQINHKLYGNRSLTYSFSLLSYISYFENDFQSFIGMENSDPDLIEGTLVFHHKYFNFIDMVHFKTNASEIFNNSGIIEADFYANLPMNNISNLFKDFIPEKIDQRIDLDINKP